MPRRGTIETAYHLLVTRKPDGFGWEVRSYRFVKPTCSSPGSFPTREDAQRDGERVLLKLKEGQTLYPDF